VSSVGIVASQYVKNTWQQQVAQIVSDLGASSDYLWWRLNDTSGTNLVDSSGLGRTGTRSGSTITTGVTGALQDGDTDKAMSFTGTNPVGQVAYISGWDVTQWTVVFWFKTITLATANTLVARDSQSGGRRWQYQINSSGQLIAISNNSAGMTTAFTTAATYNDAAWHMVTFTYDQTLSGSSRHKLYADNSASVVSSGGSVNNMVQTSTAVPFSVGNATRTTQAPANCSLDEILFFPGKVMTGDQHLALYQSSLAA